MLRLELRSFMMRSTSSALSSQWQNSNWKRLPQVNVSISRVIFWDSRMFSKMREVLIILSKELSTIVSDDLNGNSTLDREAVPKARHEQRGYEILTMGVSNLCVSLSRMLKGGLRGSSGWRMGSKRETRSRRVSCLWMVKARKRLISLSYSSWERIIGQEMQLSIRRQLLINRSVLHLRPAEVQLMSIKKTEEFTYFQNKAKHYDNIRNARPTVQTWRGSKSIATSRKKSPMLEYEMLRTNEALVNNIMSIQHSPRSRVEVQNGHTRYNNFQEMRKSQYRSFRHQERDKSIHVENSKLYNRILEAKPSYGTIDDWQNRSNNLQSRKKLASKVKDGKMLSLYSRDRFVPEHYKTFLERDGSTMVLQDKLFELPRLNNNIDRELFHNKTRKADLEGLDLDWRKIIKDTSGEIHPATG